MPADCPELIIELNDPQLNGLSAEGRIQPLDPLRWTRDAIAKRRVRIQSNGQDIDLTGATLKSAVGKFDQDPTSGTFTLTYGANTTTPLNWNDSSATVQAALVALASIGVGGVTVAMVGTLYEVSWTANGARTLIEANTALLKPPTTPMVKTTTEGAGGTKEVQLVGLSQSPFAASDNWTVHQGGTATSTQDFAGSFSGPARYTITFDPAPTGGLLQVTCGVQEVVQVAFSGATGADADGLWFTLSDHIGVVGFYITDGTTTSPPAELLAQSPYRIEISSIASGDSNAAVNSDIELRIGAMSGSFTTGGVTIPIVVTNVFAGSRTPPSMEGSGLISATVSASGFSASGAIKIGASKSAIENALGQNFTVTLGEDSSINLIAVVNRALPNLTLDDTNVVYPDYFEGTMSFDQLPMEWAFELPENAGSDFIVCTTEFVLTRLSQPADCILQFPSWAYRNLIRSGQAYNPSIINASNILTGNLVYVDETYGDDSSGVVNRFDRPYLTPTAAKTAATSGDTIIVRPGAYTTAASLAKNGVNWRFEPGASVTFADDVSTAGIWDDGGSAMTFTVDGYGDFIRSTTDDGLIFHLVNCSHASSNITVRGRDFNGVAIDGACSVFRGTAGELNYDTRNIIATGSNIYANWWINGDMRGRAKFCSSEYVAAASSVTATPTGEGHFTCEEVHGIVASDGSDTVAAYWVTGNILVGSTAGAVLGGGNRLYTRFQKVSGPINCSAGLLYAVQDKVSALANGSSGIPALVSVTGGTAYVKTMHYDPVTFTGQMLKQTGGTLTMFGGDYVGISGSDGFEITGGSADLRNVVLNTAASTTDNPIVKSGGTLILRACTLVSNGSRDSIEAGTAQNVVAMNCWANNPVDANVTVTINTDPVTGFTVDADVV